MLAAACPASSRTVAEWMCTSLTGALTSTGVSTSSHRACGEELPGTAQERRALAQALQ